MEFSFEHIYQVVRLIPFGRVSSYGAIGRYLGSAQSARMVGWAMNNAHLHADVPAHRVVNRSGVLTGKHHFGNDMEMQRLLEAEGIEVVDDQIVHFDQLFWDPNVELG